MKCRASAFRCGLPLFVACCGVSAEPQPAYRNAAFQQQRQNAKQLSATVADDIIHLLQSSVLVKAQPWNETVVNADVEKPVLQTPESLAMLEDMILSSIREGRFSGESEYIKAMAKRVKQMQKNIVKSHKANQKWVHRSIDNIKKCSTVLWSVAYKQAIDLEDKFDSLTKKHKECYLSLSDVADSLASYKVKYENAKAGLDVAIERIKDAEAKQTPATCKPSLWPKTTPGMRARMVYTWFDKAYKQMVRLEKEKTSKAKLAARYKSMYDARQAKYVKMAAKCKKTAYDMDNAKCQAVTLLHNACKARYVCYNNAVKAHKEADEIIKKEERDMRIEWRSVGRMDCYLGVLHKKKKNDKKKKTLDHCHKTPVSSEHLRINYGKIPGRRNCPIDPRCPCTKEYKAEFYGRPGLGTCTKCPACKA